MDLQLSGKLPLVTGSTAGIGFAIRYLCEISSSDCHRSPIDGCNQKCGSNSAVGKTVKDYVSNRWHPNGSDRFREICGIRGQ